MFDAEVFRLATGICMFFTAVLLTYGTWRRVQLGKASNFRSAGEESFFSELKQLAVQPTVPKRVGMSLALLDLVRYEMEQSRLQHGGDVKLSVKRLSGRGEDVIEDMYAFCVEVPIADRTSKHRQLVLMPEFVEYGARGE